MVFHCHYCFIKHILNLKPFLFISAFFFILGCHKEGNQQPIIESVKADSTSLELVWEKALDTNFNYIKIYPFPLGENLVHTYDFGLFQTFVYRNGKTGDEIERSPSFTFVKPTNAAVYDEKLVFGGIKSLGIRDFKLKSTKYFYNTSLERGYLNERFSIFNNLVLTNEYSQEPKDSLERIVAIDLKNYKPRTLFDVKTGSGKELLRRFPKIWFDTNGDTMLTIGKYKFTSASTPSNLLTFNVTKSQLLFDKTYNQPYDVYNDFSLLNGKIYISKCKEGIACLDAKTGNIIWEYQTNNESVICNQPYIIDEQLLVISYNPGNELICLDSEKGTVLWRNNQVPPYFKDDIKFLIIDNVIYLGQGAYIYGVDRKTGVLLKKQRITNGKNLLISNISYSEKNKLIYAIDSSFIKAFKIKY
jgi:outer membrane protein assembly factor BamB